MSMNSRKQSHNPWEGRSFTASLSPVQAGLHRSFLGLPTPTDSLPQLLPQGTFQLNVEAQALPVVHPWSSPEAVAAVSSASSHSFSCCSRCSSLSWCRCSCSITCWCEDSISARLRSQASCGPEAREVTRLSPVPGLEVLPDSKPQCTPVQGQTHDPALECGTTCSHGSHCHPHLWNAAPRVHTVPTAIHSSPTNLTCPLSASSLAMIPQLQDKVWFPWLHFCLAHN